jgi:amidophosphoribosyltransferase
MPTYDELIASNRTIEEIRDFVGVDSLAYLSVEGMVRVARRFPSRGLCDACFTGDYPVKWKKTPQKNGLEIRV